jgi:hypothetical protein
VLHRLLRPVVSLRCRPVVPLRRPPAVPQVPRLLRSLEVVRRVQRRPTRLVPDGRSDLPTFIGMELTSCGL